MCTAPGHSPQVFSGGIFHSTVLAVFEAAQFDCSFHPVSMTRATIHEESHKSYFLIEPSGEPEDRDARVETGANFEE